jgi:hypothetical protein
MEFADVLLRLEDGSEECTWPARVAFSPAPITQPILGFRGCLEFFDVEFRGAARTAVLSTNAAYPGTVS